MKIFIVTGKKQIGKTTYLRKLSDKTFKGVITECTSRNEKKYYFNLINQNRYLLCCYYNNGMKFNNYNFDLVNDYLTEINNKNNKISNMIIDEIGWLELEKKGLYKALNAILKNKTLKTIYISMRYDIYKKLIEKFNIFDYELIDLSKIK